MSKNLTHQAAPPPAVAGLTRGQGRRGGNGLPSTDVPRAGPGSFSSTCDQQLHMPDFQATLIMGPITDGLERLRGLIDAAGPEISMHAVAVFRNSLECHAEYLSTVLSKLKNDFPPVHLGRIIDVRA